MLYSGHLMAATFLKIPELALSQEETKKLTAAVAQVSAHYDVAIDPKTLAWVQLIVCIGGLYGPRAVAYGTRQKREKSSAAAPAPSPVRPAAPPAAPAAAPPPKPPLQTVTNGTASAPLKEPLTPSEMWAESAVLRDPE